MTIARSWFTASQTEILGFMKGQTGGYTDGRNYFFLKTESPIMIQAHVDVHGEYSKDKQGVLIGKQFKIKEKRGIIHNKVDILGADDRAGCCMAFHLWDFFKKGKKTPNILLTNGEESGGWGMSVFLKEHSDHAKHFGHINLAVALDRHGCGHYVTYNDLDKEVHKYMKSFGFKEEMGSWSDIESFSDETKIPSVNVAVGYYNEHSQKEFLVIDEWFLALSRVKAIIKSPIKKRFECKAHDRYRYYYAGSGYDFDRCDYCGKKKAWVFWDHDAECYLCEDCEEEAQEALRPCTPVNEPTNMQCEHCKGRLTHIIGEDRFEYFVCESCGEWADYCYE